MSNHKAAIVTGAGSGVGRDTAIQLAAAGFGVTLCGRTRGKLEETAAVIAGKSPDAGTEIVEGDVGADNGARAVINRTLARFGRIDAIAHVAGYAPLLPVDRITPDIWRECIDSNLSAAVYLASMAWPTFVRQGSGVIVNVSSMASIDPFPHFSIYAAAKVGLNMFTRCIADEGGPVGIKAVTVAPGAIETPMLRSLFNEKMIPRDKTLAASEVAAVIVGCVTGTRGFTGGEVIVMPSP